MKIDKNENREQALFDIYRVMRPGEPPTIDTAEVLFNGLFSDWRALRSFRGWPREDEHAPRASIPIDGIRTLRLEDIIEVAAERCRICVTGAVKSTTSTISATGACARSAN